MKKGKGKLKLATIAWPKEPLGSWLAKVEAQVPVTMAAVTANYTLPVIASPSGGCTDDTWTPTSLTNAPSVRYLHTAVWTGSEMIVWGGTGDSLFLNTGGRYNPSTDSWTATSTINAPAGRFYHTAVWTGSEMIVWGGVTGSVANTGGRYNPGGDSWTATSQTGAPGGRQFHTAVWTGSEMIVWGGDVGGGNIYYNTGGKYNPITDGWTGTSITGAPAARYPHTAVWTGAEMIAWGGTNGTSYFNTGGRYCAGLPGPTPTPTATATASPTPTPIPFCNDDTWTPTSTLNGPGRYH